MKRQQVFVRAWVNMATRKGEPDNFRITNCDILDLDNESYRACIAGILFRAGALTGIKDEAVEGDHIKLFVAKDKAHEYRQELLRGDGK
jgi:hypothetical protein